VTTTPPQKCKILTAQHAKQKSSVTQPLHTRLGTPAKLFRNVPWCSAAHALSDARCPQHGHVATQKLLLLGSLNFTSLLLSATAAAATAAC
jgi:hypothetical protein